MMSDPEGLQWIPTLPAWQWWYRWLDVWYYIGTLESLGYRGRFS